MRLPVHSTTAPTATATRTATANVAGANRLANRRPKTPACIEISLRSTIGPDDEEHQPRGERELRQRRRDERVGLGADGQQYGQQGQREHRQHGVVRERSSQRSGTTTLMVAAAIAPSTRNPPAWMTSCRTAAQNADELARAVVVAVAEAGSTRPCRGAARANP